MSKARDLASGAPAPAGVTSTELGYVDGVSSAIQTQLDGKQAANANVSTTELGYLDGVTSAIQTQLDGKVPATIVDAKGDIIAATAADTVARLAVGSNDQVLTADSTAATGLKWATPAAGGMTLLSTTTLSGATTTISSISQSYTYLYGIVFGVTNANAAGHFRIAPNGSTNITSQIINGTNTIYTYYNADYFYLATGGGTGADQPLNTNANNVWMFQIDNYASTSGRKAVTTRGGYVSNNSSPSQRPLFGVGSIETNTAISSLTFSNSSGNLSTGTVLLYGVK